jgi:ribosomal protein L29
MEFKDLLKKEEKDLSSALQELLVKYQELKFKIANNQLKNIREIRQVKKNIAQIRFLLGQKNSQKAGKATK